MASFPLLRYVFTVFSDMPSSPATSFIFIFSIYTITKISLHLPPSSPIFLYAVSTLRKYSIASSKVWSLLFLGGISSRLTCLPAVRVLDLSQLRERFFCIT